MAHNQPAFKFCTRSLSRWQRWRFVNKREKEQCDNSWQNKLQQVTSLIPKVAGCALYLNIPIDVVLYRFSVFVKTGSENYMLGKVNFPIQEVDQLTIVVGHHLELDWHQMSSCKNEPNSGKW